jgi:hypothetical protein
VVLPFTDFRYDAVFPTGGFKSDLVAYGNRIGIFNITDTEASFKPAGNDLASRSDGMPASRCFGNNPRIHWVQRK